MTHSFAPRSRKVRVLATLGPASNTPEMIAKLFQAGADAFRINMSHGDQASKRRTTGSRWRVPARAMPPAIRMPRPGGPWQKRRKWNCAT